MDDVALLAIGAFIGYGIIYPAIQFFVLMPLERIADEKRILEMQRAIEAAVAAMPPTLPIRIVIGQREVP